MTTPTGTVELTEIVFPTLANHYGTLFGGNALQLMAKAAFLAARGAAARDVVMGGVTDVRFLAPVPVGHVLPLRAWVTRVGRSSFTVASQLRVAEDHAPAIVAETSCVLWDHRTNASWAMTDEVRATLTRYAGEPVGLR